MNLLGASALNNFVYCKRLFYYREVEQIEAENYYLVDGSLKHRTVDDSSHQKSGDTERITSLSLSSDKLGIAARFDVVEVQDGIYIPIEHKRGKEGNWLNHHVQLCAQAMLLEENYDQSIDYGYIYYYGSKKRVQVPIDRVLRGQTLTAIQEARQLLEDARSPETSYSNQCDGCSLYSHCLPKETEQLQTGSTTPQRVLAPNDEREILYITTNDVSIHKKYNRLIIKVEENVVKEVPLIKIRKVVLFGRVNLSHPVISLLMKNNIEVVYLNYYGKYEGTLIPPSNKNILLRKKQILLSENEEFCIQVSREIVRGKIANMRSLLQRRNRTHKSQEVAQTVQDLKGILKELDQADQIQVIRGQEGYGTKLYFQSLNEILTSDVQFSKRTRRPPEDPINALLSLGYSLLTKDIESSCRLVGLEPYVGFLHKDRYGKPSLALDLMEEFRPVIVDQLVIYLLNSAIITEEDFETEGQIRLKQKAFKKFLAQYEQRKSTEFKHPIFGYQVTYQRAFEIQTRMLAKFIMGELVQYQSLQVR